MTWKIHHVNLPAHDVRESASFFNAIFGMREGVFQRPSSGGDFRSDPAALAAFEQEGADAVGLGVNNGLHIVNPVPSFAKVNGLQHNPTIGGRVAITVPDLDAVKRRLDDAGISADLSVRSVDEPARGQPAGRSMTRTRAMDPNPASP